MILFSPWLNLDTFSHLSPATEGLFPCTDWLFYFPLTYMRTVYFDLARLSSEYSHIFYHLIIEVSNWNIGSVLYAFYTISITKIPPALYRDVTGQQYLKGRIYRVLSSGVTCSASLV